jgi:hypothetical protein
LFTEYLGDKRGLFDLDVDAGAGSWVAWRCSLFALFCTLPLRRKIQVVPCRANRGDQSKFDKIGFLVELSFDHGAPAAAPGPASGSFFPIGAPSELKARVEKEKPEKKNLNLR